MQKDKIFYIDTNWDFKGSSFVSALGLVCVWVCSFVLSKETQRSMEPFTIVLQGYRHPDMSCLI